MHQHDGSDDDCFGCRIKHVQVAVSAMPSRRNQKAPRTPDPAWERGIVTEDRPGGTRMPYLDERLNPIRVKQFAENRPQYEERIRELKSPTTTRKRGTPRSPS